LQQGQVGDDTQVNVNRQQIMCNSPPGNIDATVLANCYVFHPKVLVESSAHQQNAGKNNNDGQIKHCEAFE
jgi:hypothetical protein